MLVIAIIVLSIATFCNSQTSVEGTIRNIEANNSQKFSLAMSSAQAYLNFGEYKTYIQRNGNFAFHNVPNGNYL